MNLHRTGNTNHDHLSLVLTGRQRPPGDLQVPGKHHETGDQDTYHRRPVRDAAGLHHSEAAAEMLPGATVSHQAALSAHEDAPV